MKKTISFLFFAAITLSQLAFADVIKCTFTEPYTDSTYRMTQSSLAYKGDFGKTKVLKNISFQIKSAGVFELVSKEGKVLQTLTLNHKGSNGASDTIYPYEVKDSSSVMTASSGYGGCVSNHLKPVEPMQ